LKKVLIKVAKNAEIKQSFCCPNSYLKRHELAAKALLSLAFLAILIKFSTSSW